MADWFARGDFAAAVPAGSARRRFSPHSYSGYAEAKLSGGLNGKKSAWIKCAPASQVLGMRCTLCSQTGPS
ncbi:MAG: hypothetical protein DBX55_03420 [Verrucomicrobia bacterium]|nr:MAG: hypothetical protein DBX55_03420 [Verrucomicrobiota bacterium]